MPVMHIQVGLDVEKQLFADRFPWETMGFYISMSIHCILGGAVTVVSL